MNDAALFRYKAGRVTALADRMSIDNDPDYQRGYQAGLAAQQRLTFVTDSEWGGNGFGTTTVHRAYYNGRCVGQWDRRSVTNFAWDQHGVFLHYKEWKETVQRGFEQRRDVPLRASDERQADRDC